MDGEGAAQNGTFPSDNSSTDERNVLSDKLAEAEKDVTALQYHNKNLEVKTGCLLDEIGILKEEKKSVWTQKIELEAQLENLRDEILSLNRDKMALLTEKTHMQNEFEAAIEEKTELNSQLYVDIEGLNGILYQSGKEKEELKAKLDSISKQVETLVKENEELREQMNKIKDDALEELEKDRESVGTELMIIKGELERMMEEKVNLQDRLEEALKQLGAMKEENVGLQDQLGEAAKQALESQDGLDDLLSRLKSENAILQKKMENMGAESARQLDVLQQECFQLRKDIHKQRHEIESLHAQKSCIEQEKDVLREKLEGASSTQLESASGERQMINDFENQLKAIKAEKKGLEDEVKRLAFVVEEQDKLKERISDFEVAIEAARMALETKDNTIQQLTLEIQGFQVSTDGKEKKSHLWPAAIVAVTGAVAAAAFACHKYVKQQ